VQIIVSLRRSSHCRHSLLIACWRLETDDRTAATPGSDPVIPSKIGIHDGRKPRRRRHQGSEVCAKSSGGRGDVACTFADDAGGCRDLDSVNVTIPLNVALTGRPSARRDHLKAVGWFLAAINRREVPGGLGRSAPPSRFITTVNVTIKSMTYRSRSYYQDRDYKVVRPCSYSRNDDKSPREKQSAAPGPTSAGERPCAMAERTLSGTGDIIFWWVSGKSRHAVAAARIAVSDRSASMTFP